ncbi:leucine-rich repeat domain-containing protein [Catellatospora aurea]|uniref:Leucine-rich repeat domain-containing protein n=1 Tax=Catellatospora aurea TaxID=1337874 RepID=A0ABW2GSS2_9ACTN
MSDVEQPQVFVNRFGDAAGPGDPESARDTCRCMAQPKQEKRFHRDRQDTRAPGWLRLLDLINQAAADGREKFTPLAELSAQERRQVVTLPASIGTLTEVKHLVLYGSNLVRIPPQIGLMRNLKVFEPYTSYRLHWFPYELTRCPQLVDSTVSTRAVYGNYKTRLSFPKLAETGRPPATPDPGRWGADEILSCSVCDQALTDGETRQVWISRGVGSDVLPLLVNACSQACVEALPKPAANHVPMVHTGGREVAQPATQW